jgi:hypothetical protein
MRRRAGGHPLTLLVGELKEIRPEGGEALAFIKHVSRCPFTLSEALYLDVCRRFGRELSEWASSSEARLVAIATFLVDRSGVPNIEEISLMPTSPEWIPAEDQFDRQLAAELVRARRHFRKSPRYAVPADRGSPAFELLDTGDPPTPLFIARPRCESSAPDKAKTENAWVWHVGESPMPQLLTP